jgi:hypothetical protein
MLEGMSLLDYASRCGNASHAGGFLIKYRFSNGSQEDWHREIKRFIAAIEDDPALNGRISYRYMKANNGAGDCYHLAGADDDEAAKALQEASSSSAAPANRNGSRAGRLKCVVLAMIAETAFRPWTPRSRLPRPHPIFAMSSVSARRSAPSASRSLRRPLRRRPAQAGSGVGKPSRRRGSAGRKRR